MVMPVPSQSMCLQVYNNPSLCPVELELSDRRALDKHQLQDNTVILLCISHVFMFATKKIKTIYVIVFKIIFPVKQVHRKLIMLFAELFQKIIIYCDNIYFKFYFLKKDCTALF